MAILPDSPTGIGGVLDTGIKIFAASFRSILLIAFAGGLVSNFAALFMRPPFMSIDAVTGLPNASELMGAVLLLSLLTLVLSVIFYNALLIRIDSVVKESDMSLGEVFGQAARRFPAAIGVGILYFLCVLGGMILLIIPGIILSVYLYCAYFLAIVDRLGPMESISRSYKITKGSWWRVATILTVSIIVVIVLTFLTLFLVGAMGFASGGLPGTLEAAQANPLWVDLILVPVTNGIYMALISCMLYAVASDLKLRYDGQDLVARAETLGD